MIQPHHRRKTAGEQPVCVLCISPVVRLARLLGSDQDVDQGEEPRQPGDDTTPHRFPAPWSVRELEQAFVVLNAYN
jgi:hypothetical protein